MSGKKRSRCSRNRSSVKKNTFKKSKIAKTKGEKLVMIDEKGGEKT